MVNKKVFEKHEFTMRFSWGSCCSIFSFLCIVFGDICFSFFYFFLLAIVFSVLQFTNSHYPFCIFIRFLPVLCRVRIARYLVFCVVFCRSAIVLLSLFFLPLCCLYLFTNSLCISKLYVDFKIISTNEQDKFILR
jgi:hypothetical protein